jgi:hypothetical protein
MRTSGRGSFCAYTFPFGHSGHASPGFRLGCGTATWVAPTYADAGVRPCPLVFFSAEAAGSAEASLPASPTAVRVFLRAAFGYQQFHYNSVCSVVLILLQSGSGARHRSEERLISFLAAFFLAYVLR